MTTSSNVACGTLISSCDYGSSVWHACWVSQLATESSTLEQRHCHWHTIPSRHENCRCVWLVSAQPFGNVTVQHWPNLSASRNPYFSCWPQHWVSIYGYAISDWSMQHYDFVPCFAWMSNILPHVEGRTKSLVVLKKAIRPEKEPARGGRINSIMKRFLPSSINISCVIKLRMK